MNSKKLGFGLMRLPLTDPADTTKIDCDQVCKMADRYLETGFNYFDTATLYHNFGNSEIAFRECVAKRHSRDSYTLTDKLSFFIVNKAEQMEDNLSFMDAFRPLTEVEWQSIQKVTEIIRSKETIACTGCRYCVDGCPQKIAIPDYFKLMNDIAMFGESQIARSMPYYNHYTGPVESGGMGLGKASACIQCGQCESHCPQHLPVISYLKDTAKTLES